MLTPHLHSSKESETSKGCEHPVQDDEGGSFVLNLVLESACLVRLQMVRKRKNTHSKNLLTRKKVCSPLHVTPHTREK